MPVPSIPEPDDPILIVHDLTATRDVGLQAFYQEAGISAAASASIVISSQVIGALSYSSRVPVAFSEHDLDILRISAQVATPPSNASAAMNSRFRSPRSSVMWTRSRASFWPAWAVNCAPSTPF
ncbi:MAG: hypothetical protein IPK19_41550 [Chloroflexi bacterium]|nr:hypothetical protein [Chloroflexota bacterium]